MSNTFLVTGASDGIGRAIALGFAGAGADVAVLARSQVELDAVENEIRARGRTGLALRCDVTKPQEVSTAVEHALEEFEGLDVLVNNAGGPVFNAPFLDIRPEGFLRVLELNFVSVVRFCQAVGAHMVRAGAGSIINVDSIGASHPAPLVTPYCAAKAAVVNLTRALAQEWAGAGVRVNALSPGLIDTRINRALVEHPELGPTLARTVPLGRWGEPEDLVGAAVWLASEASAYVTGAQIPVNGGIGVVAPQARPDALPLSPRSTAVTSCTPRRLVVTVTTAPTRAGIAYSPLVSTVGTWRTSTSRSVPPPTPVIAPRMTDCPAPSPKPSALSDPVTANRPEPGRPGRYRVEVYAHDWRHDVEKRGPAPLTR